MMLDTAAIARQVALPKRVAVYESPVSMVAVLYAISIVLPEEASFSLGNLRMTITRIFILLLAPLCIFWFVKLIGEGRYKFILSDLLIPLCGIWIVISTAAVDGFEDSIKSSGINALEVIAPYLIARTMLDSPKKIATFTRIICMTVAIVGFLGILDTLTGRFFVRDVFSAVTGYQKNLVGDYRLGLVRATSTVEHPILLGTICMMSIVLATTLPSRWRTFIFAGSLTGLFLSISSAPIGGMAIGLFAMKYNDALILVKGRWQFVVTILLIFVTVVLAIHPNPRGFFIGLVALNAETAYYRLFLFDWVEPFIRDNPIFGIGIRGNVIPISQLPTTLDSEWYALALSYGIPGALMMFFGLVGCCGGNMGGKFDRGQVSAEQRRLAFALTICVGLAVYVGTTVFYWGVAQSIVLLIAGMRAGIGNYEDGGATVSASRSDPMGRLP